MELVKTKWNDRGMAKIKEYLTLFVKYEVYFYDF